MWIFGYGSIIWRPAFAHVGRRPGYVEGWRRVFFQGSTDHRGVPGAPGRVVTLLREPGWRTWGVAYQLDPEERATILEQLDVREQGGYERAEVVVHTEQGPTSALMYVATPDNADFLGEATAEVIARQIARSHGPSGANLEYLERLAEALRDLGAPAEDHVFTVERALAELDPQ